MKSRKKTTSPVDQLLGCAAIAAQLYFEQHPEEAARYPELAEHARKMNETNNAGPIMEQLKKLSKNDKTKANL